MEPADRIGLTVSAAGHGGLILLALIGGIFSHEDISVPVATTEVSLISSAEFAALQAAAPTAATESPPLPTPPAAAEAATEAPAPVEEAAPDTAAPAPEAEPEADPAPEVEEAPPAPEASPAEPTLPTPPVEEPSDTVLETVAPRPRPTDAPRVAPTPSETPAPDAAPAETVVEEAAPLPEEAPPEPPQEEAAPEEATTRIATEENVAETPESSAPVTSPRPRARPERPAPAPELQPEVAAVAEEERPAAAPEATEAAVNDALAEALSGAEAEEPQAGTGLAASGPPMTSGEKDALIVAVKRCWNVGALSTDALNTTVVIGVTMAPDGMPDSGSIRMLSAEGGDDTAARQAFEAGRRAIIRCAGAGYPLPPEKYAQWQQIEIEFNPTKMRMR